MVVHIRCSYCSHCVGSSCSQPERTRAGACPVVTFQPIVITRIITRITTRPIVEHLVHLPISISRQPWCFNGAWEYSYFAFYQTMDHPWPHRLHEELMERPVAVSSAGYKLRRSGQIPRTFRHRPQQTSAEKVSQEFVKRVIH